ncbi:DUF5687 family protein [Zobellia galactanivorans]|uniref:DUF5687 family protein n=1 Tax=Zobellia galactanivorans (strain DSM 12802 / CCUG 47099 / CIP 106680 / NCIMB 13871 / Dsij) TaxID=63186 RepID=UPI001C075CB2|nr:DUF5687 family protein [Zobellia galactanivorans]MBU3026664.1 hypothetical protein [Zobellia galactanivorans]
MFKSFSRLQWKSFFRSSSLGKSLGVKIMMGFFALYFLAMLSVLGSTLFFALEKIFPDTDPLATLSQYLGYWVLAELFLRYFMQKLPVMDIKPFLVLPIQKSSIAHYILGRSAVSSYNFLALFFFVPFGVVLLIKGYVFLNVFFWILGIIGVVLSINYINFIINKSDKALIVVGTLLLACYGFDYFQLLPIRAYAGGLFYALYENPFYAMLPLGLAALSYLINYSYLRKRIFLDVSLKKKTAEASSSELAWTRRFGAIAPFLQLDLKLIWRNKRTRSQVFVSLGMAFYGLVFYTMEDFGMQAGMLVFVGIFMTGVFLMNFGQFIPAWDSAYYSMMMSQNIPLRKYLESKAALISVSIGIMFLLSIPYVYFGWDSLAINFSCALYNLGVNVPVILFFGSMNKKRIDLTKSALSNMQGTSATQFLVALPLFGMPMAIYGLLSFFVSFEAAIIALCLLGIIGFSLRNILLDQITRAYRKKKYVMIAGFKERNS